MTELETMIRAESYIRKMADGINPITGEPAADDDMVNNVRITRCLYYVSDILKQVIANDGVVKRKACLFSKSIPLMTRVQPLAQIAFLASYA